MPLPTVDPLKKTEIELRRSIDRLNLYQTKENDKNISEAIEFIKLAYQKLPNGVRKYDYSH